MKKILLQILTFSVIFIVIFGINRIYMHIAFIPKNLVQNLNEFFTMYTLGIYHDIRFLSVAFLPLLLCGFLSFLNPLMNKYLTTGGGITEFLKKTYLILSSIYIAFIAFLCVVFSFIKYYYYEIYKSKIDIFIFSAKNDNIRALFKIALNDYPLFTIFILSLICILFCIYINIKILKAKLKTFHLRPFMLIFLNLLLIIVYILALRGPFKHVAINVQNYSFSNFNVLNDIMLNPIMAFSWAHKQFKQENKFSFIDTNKAKILEEELFPLFKTSMKNEIASNEKPSVYINLMESFGLNLLEFNNKNFNLLGDLEQHFKEDFIFTRFLSSANGTINSFANLFFISPFSNISTSSFQKQYLDFTPMQIYKKAGYKVIFIYTGNGSWQNIKNYLNVLGVDKIIDENDLINEYPKAIQTENGYGVADEFMYKKIYEILEKNPTKTLIISLSISNHPPYKIPYHPLNLENIPENLLEKLPYKRKKQEDILQAYAYANNEFGKFLSKIKQSPFKDKVIIAATGDHRVRDMNIDYSTQKAFAFSVPFYIYIPKNLQNNIYYDKYRIGSHKDIFPTLYDFSLNEAKYLSLGGRNMLTKPSNEKLEFGFNDSVWIDKNGVYPNGSNKGYFYENNTSLKDNNKDFKLDEYHKNFYKSHQELNYYQLAKRLKLINE
ncbi:sulfatase-like hydrolase/transferase [Campylobacter sp. 2018MI35]|uniref:LTA synthase family protein n=1 Tax=Campylobacter sp. 2018MI34 TaxID=2800582 RepID=UPI001903E898|nr:sulfatase-like hydrolase/transferase [Campylobacter sp. 2018MI34]MBK1991970.1 sulfatase-like hydrolase/transferase [Campylobacter sp. 2018MI34]